MPTARSLVTALLLLAIAAGGGALRLAEAGDPVAPSSDEQAYARIALSLAQGRGYRDEPYGRPPRPGRDSAEMALHWPPAAPFAFSLADRISHDEAAARGERLPAGYYANALFGTLTILAAFAFAALLAGRVAGLATGAIAAFLPALSWQGGMLWSEPLGGLLLTAALAVTAAALRRRRLPPLGLAGLLLGLAILARPNLLLVPAAAALVVAAAFVRMRGPLRGAAAGALVLGAAAAAVLPWSLHASAVAGRPVTVTTGGERALWVGTLLPARGGSVALLPLCRARHPAVPLPAGRPDSTCESVGRVLYNVGRSRPGVPPADVFAAGTRDHLRRYVLGRPREFAGMVARKLERLWLGHAAGGERHPSAALSTAQSALVLVMLAGLLAGLARRPSAALALVPASMLALSAVHAVAVAMPRYAVPLLPLVIAGGVSGWALAVRGMPAAAAIVPAPAPCRTTPPG